jgi:predicted transcriptional regulator
LNPSQLSELQHAILQILWERGEATVAEVQSALTEERPLAATTVATVLSRMGKRGWVRHRTEGRQFVYQPNVTEREIRRSFLSDLKDRIFAGDVSALVTQLLGGEDVSSEDLDRAKEIILQKERELEETHED